MSEYRKIWICVPPLSTIPCFFGRSFIGGPNYALKCWILYKLQYYNPAKKQDPICKVYIQVVVSWRSTWDQWEQTIWNGEILELQLFSQCWGERNHPKIAVRYHMGYGNVWKGGTRCLKRTPKIWWLRDTFKIIKMEPICCRLEPWTSGVAHILHDTRAVRIRSKSWMETRWIWKGWSTWHRINCGPEILRFPNITLGVVCYTNKILQHTSRAHPRQSP